ncbi:fungal hydrophobin domain-containing protein [Penicillium canariense]|uniref:Hydrophobin n=1 Tax=Penicillium canariense TaxID=189055 RepID=A0A9W9LVP9_9EURO|nr:fungal hydrophobin domain-containing protein [Penicillium canariense]KAJ5177167.1 fungal hydrophobin domain-containing protein [Penicillium canariense]
MFIKAIILAFVAVAVAVSTKGQGDTCGDGNILCCDPETAKQLTDPGLGSDVDLQNLLGQCNEVTVPVDDTDDSIKSQCSQQAVCCGESEQNGVVDIGCTPLDL